MKIALQKSSSNIGADKTELGPTTTSSAKISGTSGATHIPFWVQTTLPIQTSLRINAPGDRYEQEADRVADQVMRMPNPQVQHKTCSCGKPAGSDGMCTECKKQELGIQRMASGSVPQTTAPPIVHQVLQQPGRPLDGGTRSFMESRFGQDFGGVRVHTGTQAIESAKAVNARAYTVGHNIVFNTREFAPHTPNGIRLLAHELTHTRQQVKLARQEDTLVMRETEDELRAEATYPTELEQSEIQDILNPQQEAAQHSGQPVPEVDDPDGFRSEMKEQMADYISRVLPAAQDRANTSVTIDEPEVDAIGDVIQPRVEQFYGRYISAATHSPKEQKRRAAFQLSDHLHLVDTALTPETDNIARDWVASRMDTRGGDLLQSYHVLSGNGERDRALFESVRDEILTEHQSDVRLIIRFHSGYESSGEAYIQGHLHTRDNDSADEALRRGRWSATGTIIHEMLHTLAHEEFEQSVRSLEQVGIAIEGFTEYFTRPVYEQLAEEVREDDALRQSIEGVEANFSSSVIPSRTSYQRLVDKVEYIRTIVGDEDNLKVAYFLGDIEYLGLGNWNAGEAAQQRYPGNSVGFGLYLTQTISGGNNSGALFRVDYGRIVLGRSSPFQIHVGGTINYLSPEQRLALGGSMMLQYSGENLYIRGGVNAVGSAATNQPFGQSIGLDIIPRLEAGAQIPIRDMAIIRPSVQTLLLIPVAGGPINQRSLRLAGGIGLSIDF